MPDDPRDTREGLRAHRQILEQILEAVQREIDRGATEDEAVANLDFPEFHRFKGYSGAGATAIRRAYAELTGGLD